MWARCRGQGHKTAHSKVTLQPPVVVQPASRAARTSSLLSAKVAQDQHANSRHEAPGALCPQHPQCTMDLSTQPGKHTGTSAPERGECSINKPLRDAFGTGENIHLLGQGLQTRWV